MGAKFSVLGLIVSFSPYLRSVMVRFPLIEFLPNIKNIYIYVSHVTCHESHVTICQVSSFLDKGAKIVGGGSVINGTALSSFTWMS